MAKRKQRKVKEQHKILPPGDYQAIVTGLKQIGQEHQNIVRMTFRVTAPLINKGLTDPKAGQFKFFVICGRLSMYTSIGAENRHHASNKATKLFGPNWSQITTEAHFVRGYQFYKVDEFNELIRTLQN